MATGHGSATRLRAVMVLIGLGIGAVVCADDPDISKLPPPAAAPVDFIRDIQPILANRCVSCHGPEKQRGGFRIDRKADALKGGDIHSPAIVPKKSAESPLIHFVGGLVPGMLMPRKGEPLTPKEIGLLRAWIDQGTAWPDNTEIAAPLAAKRHWAFQPVARPSPPLAALHSPWPRNPIDIFILTRLEKERLAPSPEAERRTLIRRVCFDLIGLPPTPAEVDAFVNDPDPLAYEKLVDRLLASPQFGERWARHWLDVVRFAESHGFETNQPRPNAWPYRDYVIRAFNDDKPYDQFIREQLAGDALGIDEATGFLVAGAWDSVKSPDPVLTAQQRADELHDMVATTGSAFLGVTVGCARCHSHKFDPIPQTDYYAIKAVFAGVQHGERRLPRTPPADREQQAATIRGELERVERALDRFIPLARVGAATGTLRPPVQPGINVERFPKVEARWVRFTSKATNENSRLEPCLDELEVWTAEENPRNAARGEHVKRSSSGDYNGNPKHLLEHVNDGRYGNDRSWISNQPGRGWVQIELPQAVNINKIVWGRDREGKYTDRLPVDYRIEVAVQSGEWRTVAGSEDRKPFVAGAKPEAPYSADGMSAADAAELKRLLAEREQLTARLKALTTEPMVYAGKFETPGPILRFHRGDPMQPREVVGPSALSELGSKLHLPTDTPERERRLALARWVTDPRHPLTARVIVNRLWHYHFGTGIVNTPSDFGINGARPTHPELLDWLAVELIEHSWSLKHIHRLIVTSATYRQASTPNEQGLRLDAGSRLLWRYPHRRLEAEPLRDAILAVSGRLDLRMGGPGFDLFDPNTNYVKVYNSKQRFEPDTWRRMVYQNKPRMQLDDTFGAFDCPDAGQIAPRRTSSTTPLQALNLLNSPFLLQQAGFLTTRLEREAGTDVNHQVRLAFRLLFSREPTTVEVEAATRLIREHGLTVFARAMLNANEFLYVH